MKTLEKSIRNSKGNATQAEHSGVMSYVVNTVMCLPLVQNGVLSIPKAANIKLAVPTVSGQYNVTLYLVRLCMPNVKTAQNILRVFLKKEIF